MKPKRKPRSKTKAIAKSNASIRAVPRLNKLLSDLRSVITQGRDQILRTVDVIHVQTCWGVGRHIVEFEQRGAGRAKYGEQVLQKVAEKLTAEFGTGFSAWNLHKMTQFYTTFPILDALRPNLSWTHYRILLRVEDTAAREWYMNETAAQNWSSRALERQIGRLYYERLLSSKDRKTIRAEAQKKIAEMVASPREFIRDPVLLEFVGLPQTGRLLESNLEQSLIDHLQAFLLELGKGFAFVGRQVRVSSDTKDFYVDLVFYNFLLKCFVLFDLKSDELNHSDIGQMDMYVRMYDEQQRQPGDNPTVGIILCSAKDASMVRYSILNGHKQLFASRYKLILPTEKELLRELRREQRLFEQQGENAPVLSPVSNFGRTASKIQLD